MEAAEDFPVVGFSNASHDDDAIESCDTEKASRVRPMEDLLDIGECGSKWPQRSKSENCLSRSWTHSKVSQLRGNTRETEGQLAEKRHDLSCSWFSMSKDSFGVSPEFSRDIRHRIFDSVAQRRTSSSGSSIKSIDKVDGTDLPCCIRTCIEMQGASVISSPTP